MKKPYLYLGVLALIVGCTAPTKQEEAPQAKGQEPEKPEETEIWEPVPKQLTFNESNVPSDAIILFDGSSLDAWESATPAGGAAPWTINEDGSMTVAPGTGDIQTKEKFGSIQLHLEWSAPDIVANDSQQRGNSGLFFQNRYEVQILDNFDNPTYVNGQVASIYKQHIPLVNAITSPAEWQTYDIIFHAPEFDADGSKTKSGTFTVLHNGVLVQDHVEIFGTTEYIGWPKNVAHGEDVIKLQDHNDDTNFVSYRNIWIRKL